MKLFNFKKRYKLDEEFKVHMILKDWLEEFTTYGKTFVTFEITTKGVLNLYSNHPGVMIGKAGERIDRYKKRLKEEANVKKVKLIEIRNLIGDFYKW